MTFCRKLLIHLALIIICLACNAAAATSTDSQTYLDSSAAGDWLLSQPSSEARVVGLLLKTGPERGKVSADSSWAANQIATLLDETSDPGELYLLAVTCQQARIQSDCVRLGLDRAIVEHDRGNLLSRGLLIENETTGWRTLLLEETQIHDHTLAIAPVIQRQLIEYVNGTEAEFGPIDSAIHAMAITWALPLISFHGIVEMCRSASDALLSACRDFAGRASAAPNTLIVRNIGLAMLAELTEDPDEAQQFENVKNELMGFAQCVYARLPEDYMLESASPEIIDTWLNKNAELGEADTLMHFNQHLELGCTLPDQGAIS